MIAVYLRVSSKDQDEASQRSVIERYLVANGISEVEWFIDKKSGTNLERASFRRLDQLVMTGKCSTVICFKLDRLSRSIKDGIDVLTRWLKVGVRLVAVTQDLDFSGAVGKMVAAILFSVAEMENETRRERQMAGIALAKEKGLFKGRKPGSIKKKNGPERAAKLWAKGMNVTEVARALGVARKTALRYLGDLRHADRTVKESLIVEVEDGQDDRTAAD